MDEDASISEKTQNREIAAVKKMGYMDGAMDGQDSVFQSSFDMGYQQGFFFGFELGIKKALSMHHKPNDIESHMYDPRKINCQVCLSASALQYNVAQLNNKQTEANMEYLRNKITLIDNQ